ncbi:MAG: hypothetical protein ACQEUZ_04335 [Pseudomonadota bacterium]
MADPRAIQAELKAMGEKAVREKLRLGRFGGRRREIAERWIADRDRAAQEAAVAAQARSAA